MQRKPYVITHNIVAVAPSFTNNYANVMPAIFIRSLDIQSNFIPRVSLVRWPWLKTTNVLSSLDSLSSGSLTQNVGGIDTRVQ